MIFCFILTDIVANINTDSYMEKLVKTGRVFYGIAMAAVGFQQFFNADFAAMILPPLHPWIPGLPFWAYFSGAALMASGAAIIFGKKVRITTLALGSILLALFCFYYIPYEIIVGPYSNYLGNWTDAEKELALAGGAFAIAGSFPKEQDLGPNKSFLTRFMKGLISFGGIFFSITMISFGIDHFLYTKHIKLLVPSWIPYPVFWTYFAAIALIGSGIAIILKIQLKIIATLLGTMIFLWFICLHIPRVIANPFDDKGSELTSAFSALAFSGTAFVIAGEIKGRRRILKGSY
jgi:uncharacterized membrane protein